VSLPASVTGHIDGVALYASQVEQLALIAQATGHPSDIARLADALERCRTAAEVGSYFCRMLSRVSA
jgi:hypothetical protein